MYNYLNVFVGDMSMNRPGNDNENFENTEANEAVRNLEASFT